MASQGCYYYKDEVRSVRKDAECDAGAGDLLLGRWGHQLRSDSHEKQSISTSVHGGLICSDSFESVYLDEQ